MKNKRPVVYTGLTTCLSNQGFIVDGVGPKILQKQIKFSHCYILSRETLNSISLKFPSGFHAWSFGYNKLENHFLDIPFEICNCYSHVLASRFIVFHLPRLKELYLASKAN